MKAALSMILLAALSVPAAAQQPRPSVDRMTCAQAAGLVAASGAIVLSTGPYTYNRFVAHVGHCLRGEMIEPTWVTTRDAPQCYIGFICRERPPRLR